MTSDNKSPPLASLVLKPVTKCTTQLRRSPRKQKTDCPLPTTTLLETSDLIVSSEQRCSRATAAPVPKTSVAKPRGRPKKTQPASLRTNPTDDGLDRLVSRTAAVTLHEDSSSRRSKATRQELQLVRPAPHDKPVSSRAPKQSANRSTRTAARVKRSIYTRNATTAYIAKEAYCDDLNESSGTDGQEEDTDLSGFIVDDNAEISFNDVQSISSDGERGSESESEGQIRRRRRRGQSKKNGMVESVRPRRRLVRGRRRQLSDSEAEDNKLLTALDNMTLDGDKHEEEASGRRIEVVDLTSSPAPEVKMVKNAPDPTHDGREGDPQIPSATELFSEIVTTRAKLGTLSLSSLDTLQAQPGIGTIPRLFPSISSSTKDSSMSSLVLVTEPLPGVEIQRPRTPTTPLATPPASPSKLKSPSKLLSPSKRNPLIPKTLHRQSTDAFWDLEVINNHNDTYSPRKALLISPRKQLNVFGVWQEDVVQSRRDEIDGIADTLVGEEPAIDESEFDDDLPSPCASPTKSAQRTRTTSTANDRAARAEQKRLAAERKTKAAAKKKFDLEKDQMARDLVSALDRYVCGGQIANLTASTGGVKVVWSKTLRQTAGRANWQRSVRKNPTSSPVKHFDVGNVDTLRGCETRHTASIELAEKIIDRPERLVNTLSHEFCHLANFMISHVKDQPHGASFQQWGRRVSRWLSSGAAQNVQGYISEWAQCEVTTKHSYVVEMKYLWICTGRPAAAKQTLIEKMMGVSLDDVGSSQNQGTDPEGCGAEYGRHSKSIDTDRQRCGRCKGFLKQIRPTPRASSPRKGQPSPRKGVVGGSPVKGTQLFEKMLGAVENSI